MAPIELELADLTVRERYHVLTGLCIPRPIAWVSTLSASGARNLAPHSYFNICSTDPPICHFTSSGRKDTLGNVESTAEFVVNLVSRDLVGAMNLTAADFPPAEDEFAWAGLDSEASCRVSPPRVAAARAALECRVHEVKPIGNAVMVFGEVLHAHVSEAAWRDGRVDPERLEVVGRLGGSAYALVDDIFRLRRPTWDDVRTGRRG